jgi:hypothetical protein
LSTIPRRCARACESEAQVSQTPVGADRAEELVWRDPGRFRVGVGATVGRIEEIKIDVQADAIASNELELIGEVVDLVNVEAANRTALEAFSLAGFHVACADEKHVVFAQRSELRWSSARQA